MTLYPGDNEIFPTLNELSTITSPQYVIVFVNDHTKYKTACMLGADLSEYPDRYNKFQLTVKDDPEPLDCEVFLPDAGDHKYFIFETQDASSFEYEDIPEIEDISGLVERGRVKYITESVDDKYYKNKKEAVKTYVG